VWTLAAIYLIVLVLALIPAWRARRRRHPASIYIEPSEESDRRITTIVGSSVGVTVIILFVILFGDFFTGIKSHALANDQNSIRIKITGHQWWWEVTYQDDNASKTVTDANEIHVPVGKTVRLELTSGDVIHSFWAPNFAGKKDLIPGHPTALYLRAQRTGTFWGQCAEYCGYEHAKMRFAFIVQSPEDYDGWIQAARQPAQEPQTSQQKRGREVFLARSCSMCHTITGTQAGGRLGPDLTHIASRSSLAAGTLPNSMGHLAGWIADPQAIKPGVNMPQQAIEPGDLQPLLEYLENLK
jgi:cytochrome c oxidase subunit 2